MFISDERGAEKSTFSKLLLKNRKDITVPSPERIVWCYRKRQRELLKELPLIDPKIEYIYPGNYK